MFRRDKDTRLDQEGLRRMREAIRHRLEHEEGEVPEGDAATEEQYRAAQGGDEGFEEVAPFNPDSVDNYGGEEQQQQGYSYLTSGRQDRTLPAFELSPTPARAETPSWTATPTPPAQPEPVAPVGPAISTVATDTSWRGTLRSGASIQIDGSFEGQIETEQELTITGDARVEATVRAESITVAGQLNGQINCRGRLEILPTGRVSGQIDAGRFVVHEGAYLGGQVRMTSATNADEGARPMLQRVR